MNNDSSLCCSFLFRQQYGPFSESAKDESHQYDNDHPHNKDDFAVLESRLEGSMELGENAADDLKLGAEGKISNQDETWSSSCEMR